MKITSPLLRRFCVAQQGVALIEFALVLPIIILFFLAGSELAHYIYTNQKAQNAAYNVLNLVNQQNHLSPSDLDQLTSIVPYVMDPIDITNRYGVFVTAIQKDSGVDTPYVMWNYRSGASAGASRFSSNGACRDRNNGISPSALPGFTFADGDQVIAVELYVPYEPLVDNAITRSLLSPENGNLYFFVTARPRKGSFQFCPSENV